jgi:hypothetical protein
MKLINLVWGIHEFVKLDVPTDRFGVDQWQCRKCGVKGTRQGFSQFIYTDQNVPDTVIHNCNLQIEMKTLNPTHIKIYHSRSHPELETGSIHAIITPPHGKRNWESGVWIKHPDGHPILILYHEFMVEYNPVETPRMGRLKPPVPTTMSRLKPVQEKPKMGRLR